jgi:hypothetical protein
MEQLLTLPYQKTPLIGATEQQREVSAVIFKKKTVPEYV